MKVFIFSVCAFLASSATSAAIINFSCTGTFVAPGIQPETEVFDLAVNTDTGEIFGFRNPLAPGCIEAKVTFTIDERSAQTSCKGILGMSSLTLSRLNGQLKVFSIQKNGVVGVTGQAKCRVVEKKIF